jgi:hypothetical protein
MSIQIPLTKANLKKLNEKFGNAASDFKQTDAHSVTSSRVSRRSRGSVKFAKKKNRKVFNKRKSPAKRELMRNIVMKHVALVKPHVDLLKTKYNTTYQIEKAAKNLSNNKDSKFILVDQKDMRTTALQKEVDDVLASIDQIRQLLAAEMKGGNMAELDLELWAVQTDTSSANTAFSTTSILDPHQSSEFSSLAALYDIFKVDGFTFLTDFISAGGTPTEMHWIMAYDPFNAGTFSAVVDALPSKYNSGLQRACVFSSAIVNAPLPVTGSGFHRWTAKCPHVPSLASTTNNNNIYTGDWTDTANATTYYGFRKPYWAAGGASVVTQAQTYVGYHCKFRFRT